jgi:hypothetical protein
VWCRVRENFAPERDGFSPHRFVDHPRCRQSAASRVWIHRGGTRPGSAGAIAARSTFPRRCCGQVLAGAPQQAPCAGCKCRLHRSLDGIRRAARSGWVNSRHVRNGAAR